MASTRTAQPQRSTHRRSTLDLGPVTRVGGGLGARIAIEGDRIADAHVVGSSFRGYETILQDRDARDVMGLSSRACGWCGGVHATTASMGLEMAWGLRPPPMGIALRIVAQATEAIWVHASHLALRAGPDYCAPVMQTTAPHVWKQAVRTDAPGAAIHGYESMADLMHALTPVTGHYWHHTVPAGRRVLEMINLVYGKYPHPSVLSPGGVGSTLTIGNFTEYYTRLYRSVDYVKRVIAIWDDLVDFLPEADERFAELGERPASFIHAGAWDDADHYDGSYATADDWAAHRLARPGVMIDGELVEGQLSQIQSGIEEHADRSFYEPSSGQGSGPDGAALSSAHPWNRTTIPRPQLPDYDGRYSWCTAPRWRGEVLESTPLGRLWLAATDPRFPPNDFIEPTGHSVKILVPGNQLPEMVVEWHVPQRANALERLRADAYAVAFSGLCSAIGLLKGFQLLRTGQTSVSTNFEVPKEPTIGVGLWESGRGLNIHWMRTDRGRVTNYQIQNASTWNASPRDASGRPGPIEEALVGSPVIEEPVNGRLHGVDALRVIHSFDPCMNCAAH